MSRSRLSLLVPALTAVCLLLAACSSAAPPISHRARSAQPVHGGSLAIGLDSDPGPVDPLTSSSLGSEQVKAQIFDPLLRLGANNRVEPNLARSWTRTGATTYTFHLRPGVEFQDGTPFNAAAVRFNLERMASSASIWSGFLPLRSVTVMNPLTVKVVLDYPFAPFLSYLTYDPGYMVSPATVRKWGKNFGIHPVGTGPFELVDWVKNDHMDLRKNPHYWQPGRPYLDRVTYRFIPDPTVKVVDLISGAVQTVDYVDPAQVKRVTADTSLIYKTAPGTGLTYLNVNPDVSPLNNPNVREAISLAINRQAIVKYVAYGLGEPARSVVTPAYWAYNNSVPPIRFDLARARALLRGRHYSLTMQVPPTYPLQAQVVKQDLAAIGIDVTLEQQDWTTAVNNLYKGNFQLQYFDDLPAPWPDPDGLLYAFYAKKGAFNGVGYTTPELQSLVTRAREVKSQAKRKALYIELQKLAQHENLYIPVYYLINNRAWYPYVHDVPMSPDGILRLLDVWVSPH
jgi:peptide/nickel transport system substrate-binding protein